MLRTMKKGTVFRLVLLFAAAGLIIYLLFPLSSKKYRITFDQDKIDGKKRFLDSVAGKKNTRERGPNILIITADDLGKTDISLYGGEQVDTPHMDSIGEEGVTFTEAYATSPICSPSRAGLLTGRYQQRFGFEYQPRDRYPKNLLERLIYTYVVDLGDMFITEGDHRYPRQRDIDLQGLPPSEINLAELLGSGGYNTAIMGKWHLGYTDPFIPNNAGFDYQYGFYEAFSLYAPVDDPDIVNYRHDYFANKYIWRQERKGPCAIQKNNEVIEEKEYLTFRIAEEVDEYIRTNRDEPFFIYASFNAPHTPFQVPREYYNRFDHLGDENKRVYYAMISALDDAIGTILETLRSLGLEEDTLILFASDNGGATYTGATDNAPLKGGKFTNFEGGINIPCMIRWKGQLAPGVEYKFPVSLTDFFVTAVSAAGIPLPEDRVYDGVDLLPFVRGEISGAPHRALYWRSGFNKAIRMNRLKLILDTERGTTILYDLLSDKTEKQNVADQYPVITEKLKDKLRQWEHELRYPLWPHLMDYRFIIDGEEYIFAL